MKRITSLLLVIAFAGAILLPVAGTVNKHYSDRTIAADGGGPVPPTPPTPPIGCEYDAQNGALPA
jgi:hypothetical protein